MMTARQKQAYDFIAGELSRGRQPSLGQIALGIGCRGRGRRSRAFYLVGRLIERGFIQPLPFPQRGLALVDRTGERVRYFRFDDETKQLVEWHHGGER